jgi:K+-transporting ATPase ATPase A chain
MEGKEVRFGVAGSALTAVITSNTVTGSYNSMHDSFSSLGGMVLLVNMLLGELIFGGLGSGIYGMVMAAAIAVFLGGLRAGRTPEYLGKKIGPTENKMVMLYALAAPLVILPLVAIAVSTNAGLPALTTNVGPHGFTGILFAYTSCLANDGQSFAGPSVNTPFYNLTTALAMMVGRFGLAIPALALAPLLGRKKYSCFVGNASHGFRHLRTAAHSLFSHFGGAQLSTCSSAWSNIGAFAIWNLNFRVCLLCNNSGRVC